MPKIIFAGLAAVLFAMLFATPLQAQTQGAPKSAMHKQDIVQLKQEAQEAYAAENWIAFYVANMKLNQLRPFEAEYMANIVRACALLDRKSTAYHYMLKMQQQGMSYDFNLTDDTLGIRDTEAYEYINNLLIEAGKSAGVSNPVFTLPGQPADFRSIAWDESRERFLVGTMSNGSVIAVAADGTSEVLLEANDENGLWSINGIAVDAAHNRLWVSSAATPLFEAFSSDDKNPGALFEFNLETLEPTGRYDFPVDGLMHLPGSVAVTDDGFVYVIDRATPIIYRKAPGSEGLEAFFASPDLLALRDIAVVPDNSRIFVADAGKGILTIDPIAQQAALITGPETLNLGGIDSIEYNNGQLFVVQGGFSPQRIVRLELDDSAVLVENVSPMAIALEEFNQPGNAVIRGNDLYYFANSGAQDAESVVVLSTPLDAGVQVAPPDMSQFEEAIRAKQQQTKD